MKIKIKASKFIIKLFFIISLFFLVFINWHTGNFKIEDILFFVNILFLFFIVGKTQFSILSLWAIISNYVLINVYYVYKTGHGYGLLGMTKHIYMLEFDISILILNISLIIWGFITEFLKREKESIECSIQIKKGTCEILALMGVISTYIAFPRFGFGFSTNRFEALLPGHFWNHLMVVLMIFATIRLKDSRIVKGCLIVITIWLLAHGERVDIIGLYAYLFLRTCVKKGYHVNFKFIMRFFLLFVIVFSILIYIGSAREGNLSLKKFSDILSSLFSQSTASDVGFVYNSTIDYTKKYGLLDGKTFIVYLQGFIPLLDQPMRAGAIIGKIYSSAGGEFILTEPFINFGFVGIAVLMNLYIFVIYQLIKRQKTYAVIVFYFLIAASFRYLWYGPTYIETGIIYLIPFVWICTNSLKDRMTIRRSKSV